MANQKASWHRLLPVLQAEHNKVITDITAIRATLATLITAFNNVLVKLDQQATSATITNFATNFSASYGNQSAPSAITAVGVDWA